MCGVRRLIRVLPRWLYRLQPVFFCMALFGVPMWVIGVRSLAGSLFMVLFGVPGQALFWLLSWLAVRRSPEKRLGFSTLPFSVYLLAVPIFYVVLPNDGPVYSDGDRTSAAMRLASVMGVQFERSLSYELTEVFGMVMLASGALALVAALVDIDRGRIDRAFDKAVAGSPAQQEGKNEQAEAETAPTPTGAAPQEPPACG